MKRDKAWYEDYYSSRKEITVRLSLNIDDECHQVIPCIRIFLPNREIGERTFPSGELKVVEKQFGGLQYSDLLYVCGDTEFSIGADPDGLSDKLFTKYKDQIVSFISGFVRQSGYIILDKTLFLNAFKVVFVAVEDYNRLTGKKLTKSL